MVTVPWRELEINAPDLAAVGRSCLYFYGPGLGFLATVRADGGPRVHPICPGIVDGSLWFLAGDSPKRRDLERDPRYALHSFPQPEIDDEFYIRGIARRDNDPARDNAVRTHLQTLGVNTGPDDALYELQLDRVLHSKYQHRGQWPPTYTKWQAPE